MAVLVSLLAPNVIKYLEQSKVGKDINTLDVVRDVIEAEITDEKLCNLDTDEANKTDGEITGMLLSEIYAKKSSSSDGKWGTLGYRIFESDKVLAEIFHGEDIFVARVAKGGKIKVYINGKGAVAVVGVDEYGKIINDGERDYIVTTKFTADELAKFDCR
jgi:hypothetical protein